MASNPYEKALSYLGNEVVVNSSPPIDTVQCDAIPFETTDLAQSMNTVQSDTIPFIGDEMDSQQPTYPPLSDRILSKGNDLRLVEKNYCFYINSCPFFIVFASQTLL